MTVSIESKLTSYQKEIHGDGPINVLADDTPLQKIAPFKTAEKIGKEYQVPVTLTKSAGFSYFAGSTVGTMRTPVAHQSAVAKVNGSQMLLEELVGYADASRAASTKQSYQIWSDYTLTPSLVSARQRLEDMHLYGATSIGKVASASDDGYGNWTVTLTAGSMSVGIWRNAETTPVDVFSALTGGTQRNSTDMTVSTVNIESNQIVISGTASGITTGDFIFYAGARGQEAQGLDYIFGATTLYDINTASYTGWKAVTHTIASSGTLTATELAKAVAKGVNRGLSGKATLFVPSGVLGNITQGELTSLRSYDSSYSKDKIDVGSNGVTFHMNGVDVEIVTHTKVKNGEAFLFPDGTLSRIGSADLSLKEMNSNKDFFFDDPTKNGYKYRMFSDQALFVREPSKCVKIVNASGVALF